MPSLFVREASFVLAVTVFARRGFLGFGMLSAIGAFSLSDVTVISSMVCFASEGCSFLAGLGAALLGFDDECCGIGGRGWCFLTGLGCVGRTGLFLVEI